MNTLKKIVIGAIATTTVAAVAFASGYIGAVCLRIYQDKEAEETSEAQA